MEAILSYSELKGHSRCLLHNLRISETCHKKRNIQCSTASRVHPVLASLKGDVMRKICGYSLCC